MASTGAINGYIDLAQLVLYGFWIFFFGLVYYIRREDKREGYPLESDWTERSKRIVAQGFPDMPAPKTFRLATGETVQAPRAAREERALRARPVAGFPGAPLVPTGNPLIDGVGPAAWAERADVPDHTLEGLLKIVPLRVATECHLESRDPDPRGFEVLGADGKPGGRVVDAWVDRSEMLLRYYEVALAGGGNVLLPVNCSRVDGKAKVVRVDSITGAQFADVPRLAVEDRVTLLEEDRVMGYYAGGKLYAMPSRQEAIL